MSIVKVDIRKGTLVQCKPGGKESVLSEPRKPARKRKGKSK